MKIYKRRKEKLEEIDELYQAFSNVTSEESGNVISDENNRNLQYKDTYNIHVPKTSITNIK